jgi:hypothetical protein
MADEEEVKVSSLNTNPFLRRDKVRRNSGIKVDRNFSIPSDDLSEDEDESGTPTAEEPQTATGEDSAAAKVPPPPPPPAPPPPPPAVGENSADIKVAAMEAKMKAAEDVALAKRKLIRDKAAGALTGAAKSALDEKNKADSYEKGLKDAEAKMAAEIEAKIKAATQEAYAKGQKDAAENEAAKKLVADKLAAKAKEEEDKARKIAEEAAAAEASAKAAAEAEAAEAAAEAKDLAATKKKRPKGNPDLINNASDGAVEGRLTEALLRQICASDLGAMKEWLLDPTTHIEDTEPTKKHTALLWCSRIGALESLKLLIEAGADPNAKMIAGGTAIYVATQENHVDCLKVLVDSGGDVNAKLDSTGGSALDIASMMARVECLEMLVNNGADVNAVAIDGTSALYSAEQSGCPECVEILKNAGCVQTDEMRDAADLAYEVALKEAREELMEEAAERITRFIRYAGFVKKHGGGNAAKMAAMAMGGKTEKKKRRRKSITKKAKDMRASVYSGEVTKEGYLEKQGKGGRGKWLSRYFEITSHYLKYYVDSTKSGVKAACDLDDLNVVTVEEQSKFFMIKLVIGTESLVLRTAGVGVEDKAWGDMLTDMADLAKSKGNGDGKKENIAVVIDDEEEAAEVEAEAVTADELKAELIKYYESEAPEKVEEISDDLCDYFKDKRAELSAGLMKKYGIDLQGNEALWRPGKDEEETEERKNIAARRVTRFVRFCVLQKTGGGAAGQSAVNKAFGLEDSVKKTKSKARRRLSIKKSKAKFRQSVYVQEELVEGYLEKMSSGLRKKWLTRYFAVGGHYLKYFKDQMKQDVKAVIDLNFLSKMSIPSESCFDLVVNGALIQLRCPNASEFEQWEKCLQGFLDTNRAAASEGRLKDAKQ